MEIGKEKTDFARLSSELTFPKACVPHPIHTHLSHIIITVVKTHRRTHKLKIFWEIKKSNQM